MKQKMLSFHGKQRVKNFYLARVRAHQKADEIIKGMYWKDGKGCAVGCTIHGDDHLKYEEELGIPVVLAKLEDNIFENLPNEKAKIWPEQFLESINLGADLSGVWPSFAIWLLIDEKHGVFQYAKSNELKKVIQLIAGYYEKYKEIKFYHWEDALFAANICADAYHAASYTAAYAATTATANIARYAAATAANATGYASNAVDAADYADADAAGYAVDAAGYAADAAGYGGGYSDARENNIIAQADKLLELLRGCK